MKPLEEVVRNLNRKFGEGSVVKAEDAVTKLTRFSTGSVTVDHAIGGGIPEGRISLIYGAESVTKTSLAVLAAKEYLRKYPRGSVVFVDVEHTLPKERIQQFGLDSSRFYIASPDSGEQGADMVCDVLSAKERTLVISDSLAALIPTAVLEEGADKGFVGVHARLVNRLVTKASALLRRNLLSEDAVATVLFLNQERMKMSQWEPIEIPGGKAQRFFSSFTLHLRRTAWLFDDEGSDKKQKVGITVGFHVKKCKVWKPEGTGEFNFYFTDHDWIKAPFIDNYDSLLRLGELTGVLERSGHSWKYNQVCAKGRDAFTRLLRLDGGLREKVLREVMTVSGIADYTSCFESPVKRWRKSR